MTMKHAKLYEVADALVETIGDEATIKDVVIVVGLSGNGWRAVHTDASPMTLDRAADLLNEALRETEGLSARRDPVA